MSVDDGATVCGVYAETTTTMHHSDDDDDDVVINLAVEGGPPSAQYDDAVPSADAIMQEAPRVATNEKKDARTEYEKVIIPTAGLVWCNITGAPPARSIELKNTALSDALVGTLEFTRDEWDKFKVNDLTMKHIVKIDDDTFVRPVLFRGIPFSLTPQERDEVTVYLARPENAGLHRYRDKIFPNDLRLLGATNPFVVIDMKMESWWWKSFTEKMTYVTRHSNEFENPNLFGEMDYRFIPARKPPKQTTVRRQVARKRPAPPPLPNRVMRPRTTQQKMVDNFLSLDDFVVDVPHAEIGTGITTIQSNDRVPTTPSKVQKSINHGSELTYTDVERELPWFRELSEGLVVKPDGLPILYEDIPEAVRTALDSLINDRLKLHGKFNTKSPDNEQMYQHVALIRANMKQGVVPFRGWQVQKRFDGVDYYFARTWQSILGALTIAAAYVDRRLHGRKTARMWLMWLVEKGDEAAQEWLNSDEVVMGFLEQHDGGGMENVAAGIVDERADVGRNRRTGRRERETVCDINDGMTPLLSADEIESLAPLQPFPLADGATPLHTNVNEDDSLGALESIRRIIDGDAIHGDLNDLGFSFDGDHTVLPPDMSLDNPLDVLMHI